MIKVLSVCTSDANGGAARAAYRIHQGVRKLGVDSRMFVKDKHTDDANVVALDAFVPHNCLYKAFEWIRHKFKNKIQHHHWDKYTERETVFMSDLRGTDLHGALQKLEYDVLHLHWINQRFIPMEQLPKNKPIVWTLHDSWPFCGICHYFFNCEKYKQQCGDCPLLHSEEPNDLSNHVWKKKSEIYKDLDLHIVSPSRWLADCARNSSLLGHFPITVIPNCLDAETFRPLNDRKASGKHVVLYGAMNATKDNRKGFSNLVTALQLLEQQGHGNEIELVVFGASKSDLSLEVNIPVHYVGYVNDTEKLVDLYNQASVMVVPSLAENLSNAIMESLSCGTPVVAFNIGGNGDMIEHKKNGYLAKEKDDADLAEGILWCLNNNEDNCLGKAGREKVMRDYTYEAVSLQYKKLYETINNHHQS